MATEKLAPRPPGDSSPSLFLARQAIFNRSLGVIGYELLFRSDVENFFRNEDGDKASLQVIESSLNTFGLGSLSAGGRVFINLTPKMLLDGYASLLPPRSSVIELLGSIPADPALVELCGRLKKAGYLISVDDFRSTQARDPLVGLADILKVDYHEATGPERKACTQCRLAPGARLLAKKVSVQSEFKEAADLGFSLFQGQFFCKPEMMSRKQIPAYKLAYLECLREVNREEPDYRKLEEFFRRDLGLSLKLLRYVNSALVSPERRVESLSQALALVGLDLMKRWISMVAMVGMGNDRPGELIVTSLVRARFCELLAQNSGLKERASELFMVGMLSILDAILGRPMLELLTELPLSDDVKGAVLGKAGLLGDIIGLVFAYERAEWDRVPHFLDHLMIKHRMAIQVPSLPSLYRVSTAWADEIWRGTLGNEKG